MRDFRTRAMVVPILIALTAPATAGETLDADVTAKAGVGNDQCAAGRTQIDEVHAGRSYQSDFGRRLYFGLADADTAERIEVRWPSGKTDVLTNVPANQRLHVTEGTSR